MSETEDKKLAPIIIKHVKKVAGGHHGGNWKVAYADFVTAMMAFFLLLWLLATTTPEQRTGIAEYFTPTVGLKDSKGIGFEGGLTPNEKGHSRTTLTQPGLVAGQIKQGPEPKPPQPSDTVSPEDQEQNAGAMTVSEQTGTEHGEQAAAKAPDEEKEKQKDDEKEKEALKKAAEAVMQLFEMPEMQQLRKNIIITNTPEGLKIDVVDDPAHPLFVEGTATMTDTGRLMFKAISSVIVKTRNQLSIVGHTERSNSAPGATYTAWELSADRANATRRFMTESLTEPKRVAKVTGMADKELLLPKEPDNPRNRRISLTLMRGALMVESKDSSSVRDLLSVPDVDTKKLKPPAPPPPPPPKPKEPIELPETKPGSIFHQKGKVDKNADADQNKEQDNGADFNAPKDMPDAPPPRPKPKVGEPAPPPEEPVEVPAASPDTMFKGATSGGFTVPQGVPDAPPPKDDAPQQSAPAEPVQAPGGASPGSLFAP